MKKYLAAGIVSFLILFSGCPSSSSSLPELTPPDWQAGETALYEIVRNDSVLFTRTITLDFDEEGAIPIVVITNVVRSESALYYFFDSTTFALTRYTLKPVWSTRTVITEISITEVEAEFESDAVHLKKTTVDSKEEKTLPLSAHGYGIEMLQQLFRAIPLDPGLSFRIDVVVPLEFRVVPTNVTVLGTKLVATPLGDILCREVRAQAPRRSIRLLYELAQPHRLIAIHDLENNTETRLVEFSLPEPDTLLPHS